MGTNGTGCTEWERDFDALTEQPERRAMVRKAIKVTITDAPSDKYHEVWSALDNVINAWESLDREQMSPAINRARKAMGRKAPNEDQA